MADVLPARSALRLERHVGGMGKARQRNYLESRGWTFADDRWTSAFHQDPEKMSRALHIQLTADLTAALAQYGWRVTGYSPRGYAQLSDPTDGSSCTLPAALRRQARREGRKVGDLTYSLFLSAIV